MELIYSKIHYRDYLQLITFFAFLTFNITNNLQGADLRFDTSFTFLKQ